MAWLEMLSHKICGPARGAKLGKLVSNSILPKFYPLWQRTKIDHPGHGHF
jgi:hypothetical protein